MAFAIQLARGSFTVLFSPRETKAKPDAVVADIGSFPLARCTGDRFLSTHRQVCVAFVQAAKEAYGGTKTFVIDCASADDGK